MKIELSVRWYVTACAQGNQNIIDHEISFCFVGITDMRFISEEYAGLKGAKLHLRIAISPWCVHKFAQSVNDFRLVDFETVYIGNNKTLAVR